jgi:acyl-coenzyme A synthetase/AMP-(fatty) acid ligase
MSIVRSRRNPITGALVAAEVILKEDLDSVSVNTQIENVKREILQMCHASLAAHKIPATIRCVPALEVAPTGKLVRSHA